MVLLIYVCIIHILTNAVLLINVDSIAVCFPKTSTLYDDVFAVFSYNTAFPRLNIV